MHRRPQRRRIGLCAALAGLGAIGMAATANADVAGTLRTPEGAPIPGASIRVTDAAGAVRTTTTAGNGTYLFTTSRLASLTAPLAVTAAASDLCRPRGEAAIGTAPTPVSDGATIDLTLDLREFCAASHVPSGAPEHTGHVDSATGSIIAAPGGVAHLNLQVVPSSARSIAIALADGTVIGTGDRRGSVGITAPARYSGPITAVWTDAAGIATTVPLGTLLAGPAPAAPPAVGRHDLAAILDLSGSMSGNDGENRRLDATHLLIELASPGDRLLGVGFDDTLRAVFPRTTIDTVATRKRLRATARQNIGNFGGTNYDVGFAQAYAELAAEPQNPAVPKGAIFLTDGGHNAGIYENTHLRFAHNGTGISWPVCVVQLGRSFDAADTARLQRIAAETGGRYLKAPTNAQLETLYFQCRGASSGARTLVTRTNTFKVGQTRRFTSRVKKRQAKATFFVSWTEGRYRLALHQPGRKKAYVRTTGKRVRLVKGRTFQYFQVNAPKAGRWRLEVRRLATGAATERATTTINVQRRR